MAGKPTESDDGSDTVHRMCTRMMKHAYSLMYLPHARSLSFQVCTFFR